MSNVGQAALGIVGGIIGFYLGGPTGAAYGFQIGLAVGSVVSPTQLPGTYGPRLSDNRTTTASIGGAIVEIDGTDASAGTVIWIGPVVEVATTEEVGGKGGPEGSQTTYSYYQSIAVGICRGPMGGLLRIWENGKVVYDVRELQPDEDFEAYYNRVVASQTYELTFHLYLGDEDQLPDPTIESVEGLGAVPAYRGLMYIVYPDRQLKDDQARRHPNFKFEVFDGGTVTCVDSTEYAQEVLYPWLYSASAEPTNPLNNNEFFIRYEGQAAAIYPFDPDDTFLGPYASTEAALSVIKTHRAVALPLYLGFSIWNNEGYSDRVGLALSESFDPSSLIVHFNQTEPENFNAGVRGFGGYYPWDIDSGEIAVLQDNAEHVGAKVWYSAAIRYTSPTLQADHGGILWDNQEIRAIYPGYLNTGAVPPLHYWLFSDDAQIEVVRSPAAPQDACEGLLPAPNLPGFCIDEDGRFINAGAWTYDDSTMYHVLQQHSPTDLGAVTYPRGPARPVGHEDDTQAFWEAAYTRALLAGQIAAGLLYGVDYPELQGYAYRREATICTVSTTGGVSIASIIRRICARVGLTDIDVSDLEDRFVLGYQLPRVMDARSAIAPLRQVGFFDAVDSGDVVKFPVRGKPPVRVLSATDLGAHEFGEDQPPAVTTRKQQDVELPRQLWISYREPARDYDAGSQPSPTRLITESVNDVYVEVGVAIDATTAKQCAEVIWADMWAARWQHQIAVGSPLAELEPTDVVLVPVDDRLERMRIVTTDDSSVVLRQMALVRDDDGSYVSEAIADPPAREPGVLAIYDTTTLILMDLPPLREEDDDAGFYIAAARAGTGNTWGGAIIYRSTDGSAFTQVVSVTNEAVSGTLTSDLGDGPQTIFDEGTELLVTLPRGQFSSRPEDEVLAGANTLAIGAHGRWEIVQFVDAEQIGTTSWRLTRLLRGRRGTDHNIGTGIAGDAVVLISGVGIVRADLTIAQVGTSYIYRAVTINTALGTGTDQTFAGAGEALKPFSPVHLEATRAIDGALTIEFIRRDRLAIDYVVGEATPMSEVNEDYEIDILDGAGAVRRTISVSTATCSYSADQQVTDFGSVQASIQVRIYQISVAIGRGHAGEATL